jgi:2'-5' RNA ligase
MKLFIGIDIAERTQKIINSKLEFLLRKYPDFDWVPSENYHITIQYFGETNKAKEVEQRLRDLLYDQNSFYLHSRGLSLFMREKITIYLDFSRQKVLEELERKISIDFSTSNQGYKYIPHITLAKYRIPSKQQYLLIKKKIGQTSIEEEFEVKKVTLFESITQGSRSFYNKIAQIPLL